MEKKYQLFVSSTYKDLIEERKLAIQAIMELSHLPATMEYFPAADEEQWEFIKSIIDNCDYYILIIGGRYGSLDKDGLSFTEKEFDYAVSKSIKVIALVHENPDKLSKSKKESEFQLQSKLINFRKKVMSSRIVKTWKSKTDIPSLVMSGINAAANRYPAVGWVRADKIANETILNEINELRKENDKLKEEIQRGKLTLNESLKDIADLDSVYVIEGEIIRHGYSPISKEYSLTWNEIFYLISPYLIENPNEYLLKGNFERRIYDNNAGYGRFRISDNSFQTIAIQLEAYGVIKRAYSKATNGSMAIFWNLTPIGRQKMFELRVVRNKVQ